MFILYLFLFLLLSPNCSSLNCDQYLTPSIHHSLPVLSPPCTLYPILTTNVLPPPSLPPSLSFPHPIPYIDHEYLTSILPPVLPPCLSRTPGYRYASGTGTAIRSASGEGIRCALRSRFEEGRCAAQVRDPRPSIPTYCKIVQCPALLTLRLQLKMSRLRSLRLFLNQFIMHLSFSLSLTLSPSLSLIVGAYGS